MQMRVYCRERRLESETSVRTALKNAAFDRLFLSCPIVGFGLHDSHPRFARLSRLLKLSRRPPRILFISWGRPRK